MFVCVSYSLLLACLVALDLKSLAWVLSTKGLVRFGVPRAVWQKGGGYVTADEYTAYTHVEAVKRICAFLQEGLRRCQEKLQLHGGRPIQNGNGTGQSTTLYVCTKPDIKNKTPRMLKHRDFRITRKSILPCREKKQLPGGSGNLCLPGGWGDRRNQMTRVYS